MHKITKGLKKKKKNKKSKKEEDLFDAAELEKYRREREAASHEKGDASEDAAGGGAGGGAEGGVEADEWRQFKALTAGVDSVLKKTQGDLDRIKSTSYFQRKYPEQLTTPGSSGKDRPSSEQGRESQTTKPDAKKKNTKRWVGFEEGAGVVSENEAEEEILEQDQREQQCTQSAAELLGAEAEVPEEEEEDEEEDYQDEYIFDTSYVDVVTSGEVKLAYIPDSPTEEESSGFDPFDTSIAEKFIKDGEVEGKKKKLVSLGCAVEVLTGRLEKVEKLPLVSTPSGKKRRVSRKAEDVDLLLGSFDDNGNTTDPPDQLINKEGNFVLSKSLLDYDDNTLGPDFESAGNLNPLGGTALLGTSVLEHPISADESIEDKEESVAPDYKNLVAEFDLIVTAEDNFTSNPINITPTTVATSVIKSNLPAEDDLEEEFAALAAKSAAKTTTDNPDLDISDISGDPFDTSVAAVVLGVKESPTERDPFDIEVSEFTSKNFSASPRPSRPFPISPDVDIVLATDSPLQNFWAAFDEDEAVGINPIIPAPPRPCAPARPPTTYQNLQDTHNQKTFSDKAILALAEDLSITSLTPAEVDPFDTSFAENILPGKAELKLIENEILGCANIEINEARILSRSDSDFDFNPREDEERLPVKSTVSIHITDPAGEEQDNVDDPFEEVGIRSLTLSHRDLLGGSTTDLSKLGHDPIEPVADSEPDIEDTDIDPFDTSVVDILAAPGKAELKFLEKEFLGEVEETLKKSISDQDFNPREEEVPKESTNKIEILQSVCPDLLVTNEIPTTTSKTVAFDLPTPSARPDLLVVGQEEGARISKPLTPYYVDVCISQTFPCTDEFVNTDAEADPFDTSFAENLAPGKAELKLIESELVGDTLGIKHSLSDPDFNPRGDEQQPAQSRSSTREQAPSNLIRRFSDFTGDRRRVPPSSLAIRSVLVNPTLPPIPAVPTPTSKPDLLVAEENISDTAKPLTPAIERKLKDTTESKLEECDPFDTSIASNLLPGKAELKVLESELISEGGELISLKRSYTDPDFNPRDSPDKEVEAACLEKPDLLNLPSEVAPDAKPLTPLIQDGSVDVILENGTDDIDPFDTSIAGDLAPGRAELRVLESELIG